MPPRRTRLAPSDLAVVVGHFEDFATLLHFTLVNTTCTAALSLVTTNPCIEMGHIFSHELATVLKTQDFFPNLTTVVFQSGYSLNFVPALRPGIRRVEVREPFQPFVLACLRSDGFPLNRVSRCALCVDEDSVVNLSDFTSLEHCTLFLNAPVARIALPPHPLDFLLISPAPGAPLDFLWSIPQHRVRRLFVQLDVSSSDALRGIPQPPGVTFILAGFVPAALDRFMAIPNTAGCFFLTVESEADDLDGFVRRYFPAKLNVAHDPSVRVDLSRFTSLQQLRCNTETTALPPSLTFLDTDTPRVPQTVRGLRLRRVPLPTALPLLTSLSIEQLPIAAPLSAHAPALRVLLLEHCTVSTSLDDLTTVTAMDVDRCAFSVHPAFPTSLRKLLVLDTHVASLGNIPSLTGLTGLLITHVRPASLLEETRTALDLSLRDVRVDFLDSLLVWRAGLGALPRTLRGVWLGDVNPARDEDAQLALERQPNLHPLLKKHFLGFEPVQAGDASA